MTSRHHLRFSFGRSLSAASATVVGGVLAAAACGGQVDGVDQGGTRPGTLGDAGGGNQADAQSDAGPGAWTIEGSHNLTFTEASATFQTGGGSPPPGSPSPSAGLSGRLDIVTDHGSTPLYSAVLTARWGAPAAFSVTVSDSAVILDGDGAAFGAGVGGGYVSDRWKHITLDRNPDGTLSGKLHASGDEQVSEGDQIWQGDVVGAGTLSADSTAPELRSNLTSPRGPSNALLPWDPVRVQLAEPLDAPTLAKTLSVEVGDVSLPVSWVAGPVDAGPGAVQLAGALTSWVGASGQAFFKHSGGVADPSANVTAPSASKLTWFGLPGALAAHHFGGDKVATVSPWGSAEEIEDARCESTGCMKMGPYTHQGCGGSRMGFAGLLASAAPPSANAKVHVRYRILAKADSGTGAPPVLLPPLTVQTAVPGGFVQETTLGATAADYSELGAPIDGLTWATAWTTVDIAAPAGSSFATPTVGFAVHSSSGDTCGGFPFPTDQIEVLIDSVSLN